MTRAALPLLLLLAACSSDPPAQVSTAASPATSAVPVATSAAVDAGLTDAGVTDAGGVDGGGVVDAGAADSRPRLGAVAQTWIYAGKKKEGKIGYLRAGTAVVLREEAPSEKPRKGDAGGCKSGRWWSVEPRGYVCDDETVTRDLDGPLFRALALAGPKEGAYPFDYAFSTHAPMYGKVPVAKELRKGEQRMRPVADLVKIRKNTAGHEDLAEQKVLPPDGALPSFLADHAMSPMPPGKKKPAVVRKDIPYGSMLSFSRAFEADGRTYLLSPDLTLIPADRMRPFRRTSFHGVAIDASSPLPIAWFRKEPRAKLRRAANGAFEDTGQRWAKQTFVGLTGTTVDEGGQSYLETREAGLFVKASDATVVGPPDELPQGVGEEERWIDVSLGKGTLTLFVGRKATYSTLMSPGAGGLTPKASLTIPELVGAALTPLGMYRVSVKHKAAQMTSEDKPDPEGFWIADVPWVQYFRPPFAIHAAYWHEDFGRPKSGGCVNLSPEDAKVVFEFTEPKVPPTWWGAVARKDTPGTWIVIHK